MTNCTVCGNNYDKAFRVVTHDGQEHTFDSLECAITRLAPRCTQCECRIVGHGMEAGERMFCCAHCASLGGVSGLDDRVT